MTGPDDLEDMGDRSSLRFGAKGALDDDAVDALLRRPSPQDAPPGYAAVARLLALAAGPPTAEELAGEEATLAAFAAARPGIRPIGRMRHRRSARLAAAGILGGFMLTGGVAAAATGSLPGPVQNAISRALDSVGISVPDASGHDSTPSGNGSQGTGADNGTGNNGTNMGGAGNHTGVSNPTGPKNTNHTLTTHTTGPSGSGHSTGH